MGQYRLSFYLVCGLCFGISYGYEIIKINLLFIEIDIGIRKDANGIYWFGINT
jgi:hypothetical protein